MMPILIPLKPKNIRQSKKTVLTWIPLQEHIMVYYRLILRQLSR